VAYDELGVRVLLLLNSEGGTRALPAIVCDADATWLEWDRQRLEIPGQSIPDEVVDLIEAQLHSEGLSVQANPKATLLPATATDQQPREPSVSALKHSSHRAPSGRRWDRSSNSARFSAWWRASAPRAWSRILEMAAQGWLLHPS
jgi:hypothetical protein